jgi:hypothetical protein
MMTRLSRKAVHEREMGQEIAMLADLSCMALGLEIACERKPERFNH